MGILSTYILLGLSLSIPIGPINAAQLNKGMQYGFVEAWLLGLGAMVGDALFMLLIYFGVADFLTTPYMKSFLWLAGFFILVYTGIESIVEARKVTSPIHSKETNGKSFRTGFLMAISNPLNILFWLGIYGALLANISGRYSPIQMLTYSSAIFIGIFLWDLFMAGMASGLKRFFHSKLLQVLSVSAGLSLVGFGLYFGYKAISFMF